MTDFADGESIVLNEHTISDDGVGDLLFGERGRDLFFVNPDQDITDAAPGGSLERNAAIE